MHKTSIHVSLKEIWGETHSNPRNHTKNKGTKNKHEKDHGKHNAESSIQTRKDSQGLAYAEYRGVYGGGVDDRVDRRVGTGSSSVRP
jgi:hypothetical protein